MPSQVLVVFYGFMVASVPVWAQEIPIQSFSIDVNGQVMLNVNSSNSKYYLLQVRHHPDSAFTQTTSLTIGNPITTTITEPLSAYPENHYRIKEFSISSPSDYDGDGVNDLEEYNGMPFRGPLNAAIPISEDKGLLTLNTVSAFHQISTLENLTSWVEYLDGVEYTKFTILDFFSDFPKIYFINSKNYALHFDFENALGIDHTSPENVKGHLIHYPSIPSSNGTLGVYAFNFSNNEAKDFKIVQRTQEILAANMPFLTNNLAYFVPVINEPNYQSQISLFQGSRVPVLTESDMFSGINYWGLNQTEGYGYFRKVGPGEIPDSKDIVLFESLPNYIPRVGGIITSALQTPLSHINLRAKQDNIPNAFIRNAVTDNAITSLLNHYIYFKTNRSNFEMREASLDEVNKWYEKLRPVLEQDPPLNLSYQSILPLNEISFEMFDGFGSKSSNVATMRTFGFPEGTVPDGFAIPFYFYQEFMKFNSFFDKIKWMMQDPSFISSVEIRNEKLGLLRSEIKSAIMPDWMLDQIAVMQNSFPIGTSIRCRSSSNNEDLPGFSGAGLYDSKTHHPDEGHISKTIKEVFASLWNLRAFEEREFYRINHFASSMGVLCHPNFENELVNGVGISTDPAYHTKNTFYLNSQIGEELVTNPENSVPEEVLLKIFPFANKGYMVVQRSNLISSDSLLMTNHQLDLLGNYLSVIHARFQELYKARANPSFAMDIEYKVDNNSEIVIKQARPWVSFEPLKYKPGRSIQSGIFIYPNPARNQVFFECEDCGTTFISVRDMMGKTVLEKTIFQGDGPVTGLPISQLGPGIYILSASGWNLNFRAVKLIKF